MVAEEGLPWSAGCCGAVTNHHVSQVTLSHLPKGRLSYPCWASSPSGECGEAGSVGRNSGACPSRPISARRDRDEYAISGQKRWIGNANFAGSVRPSAPAALTPALRRARTGRAVMPQVVDEVADSADDARAASVERALDGGRVAHQEIGRRGGAVTMFAAKRGTAGLLLIWDRSVRLLPACGGIGKPPRRGWRLRASGECA